MPRFVVATWLALLSIACSSAPSAAPKTAAAPVVESKAAVVPVPDEVRGYRIKAIERIPGTRAQSLYRYTPPSTSTARVTAFVYAIPDGVRGSDDAQAWTEREGKKFGTVLNIMRDRGQYEAVMIALESVAPVRRDGTVIPGFTSVAATRARGKVVVEMQFLYAIHGRFLKVRASVPEAEWKTSDARLFADELAWRIALPPVARN